MQKCYLVKKLSIWGSWVPVMVCACEAEAKVVAKSFGLSELGKDKGQVVELSYQPSRGG